MRVKKGYFFVIDSLLALLIMTLGVILVFSFHKFSPGNQQISVTSADILGLLNVKIRNLNNGYCGVNSLLTRDKNITNLDNTLIEQIAELHYRGVSHGCTFCPSLISNIVRNVTANVPTEYSFVLKLEDETVYNRSITHLSDAKVVVPSRKIVQTIYRQVESAGPYPVEVLVWRS
jgi:hypothetical protein